MPHEVLKVKDDNDQDFNYLRPKDHMICLEETPNVEGDLLKHFSIHLLHRKKVDLGLGDQKHFSSQPKSPAIP